MILLGSKLIDAPVMGLQTGGELARTHTAIIDPATLKILAYEVKGPLLSENPALLTVADIREISSMGLIIDSNDDFVSPQDVVKINEIYDLQFPLVGMAVRDTKRHKLGKVTDYTLDVGGFVVEQLIVKRPLLHSLNDTELVIHRSQIVEINNDAIIVHSEAKTPEPERNEVPGSFVNPFRKTEPLGGQQTSN